jgi:hypothetical protein
MPESRKLAQVRRSVRLRQIEQMLLLGATRLDMAERLGVNEKTIRRDLEHRQDALQSQFGSETAAYRSAILAELGRVLGDAVKDAKSARDNNRHTDRYLNVRIDALRLVSLLTGAQGASKHLVLHGAVGQNPMSKAVSYNGPVQIIVEAGNGQFEPEFGEARISSPSADEISSAQG